MSTSSNAVPSPDAGGPDNTNSSETPPLTVVPAPESRPAPAHSLLNQTQLRELDLAQGVATAAQKTDYVEPLQTRQIEPAFVSALLENIGAARKLNTSVLASDVGGQQATQLGADCEAKLVGSLRRIQTAARQEYLHSAPLKLKEYLVGEDINTSRPMLEQSSQTLVDKANADRPAGLDTAFIRQVEGERTGYVQSDAAQANEVSDAQKDRARRDALLDTIQRQRQTIQFAAEFLWPSTAPDNAAVRREFRLPVSRPYLG